MKSYGEVLTHAAMYYDQKINAIQKQDLLNYLSQFPLDMVERAYTKIKENELHRYPFIATWKNYLEGSPLEKAEEAYAIATKTAREIGSSKKIVFEDKKIHAAINAIGGWEHFCFSETDPAWRHKDFINAYRSFHGDDLSGVPAMLTTSSTYKNSDIAFITKTGIVDNTKQIECKKPETGVIDHTKTSQQQTGSFKDILKLIEKMKEEKNDNNN